MKLAELRALPLGTPLLVNRAGEDAPVVFAGLTETQTTPRARVLDWDGTERRIVIQLLIPAAQVTHPEVVVQRPDLTGHTITVELITARIWPRLGIARGVAGQLAAIERTDGRLGKVCCIASDLWGGSIETAARAFADDYSAVYVPAGGER